MKKTIFAAATLFSLISCSDSYKIKIDGKTTHAHLSLENHYEYQPGDTVTVSIDNCNLSDNWDIVSYRTRDTSLLVRDTMEGKPYTLLMEYKTAVIVK